MRKHGCCKKYMPYSKQKSCIRHIEKNSLSGRKLRAPNQTRATNSPNQTRIINSRYQTRTTNLRNHTRITKIRNQTRINNSPNPLILKQVIRKHVQGLLEIAAVYCGQELCFVQQYYVKKFCIVKLL